MPDWKNIAKLSDKDAKTREAQFEAEMLAMISRDPSQTPAASPAPPVQSGSSVGAVCNRDPVPIHNGIQISVTANGQTTRYSNLEAVPGPVRQHIMSAWIGSPAPIVPPVLNTPTVRDALPSPTKPRPKSMKVAMFLNLIVPGAGQFYLGQRLAGAVYALTFLASFTALLVIFVRGYFNYLTLSTSGDIMESNTLEQLARSFPAGIISALSTIGIVIYIISAIHLAVSRRRTVSQ